MAKASSVISRMSTPRLFGAHRVLAQRLEGAAPGRVHQPPEGEGGDQEDDEGEVVEGEVRHRRDAEERRPHDAGEAERAAGQPVLVAEDEEDQRVERQRHEGEEVVLDPERRVAEHEADDEAEEHRAGGGDDPVDAGHRHDRRGVGADAHEGGLGERDLAGVAERQVEAHGGDREDQPRAQHVDDVVALAERGDDERGDAEQDEDEGAGGHQTVLPSALPSRPCGRTRMMTMSSTSGMAARYSAEP